MDGVFGIYEDFGDIFMLKVWDSVEIFVEDVVEILKLCVDRIDRGFSLFRLRA